MRIYEARSRIGAYGSRGSHSSPRIAAIATPFRISANVSRAIRVRRCCPADNASETRTEVEMVAGPRVMTHVSMEHTAAPCDAFASDVIFSGRATNSGFRDTPLRVNVKLSDNQIGQEACVCLAAERYK